MRKFKPLDFSMSRPEPRPEPDRVVLVASESLSRNFDLTSETLRGQFRRVSSPEVLTIPDSWVSDTLPLVREFVLPDIREFVLPDVSLPIPSRYKAILALMAVAKQKGLVP